MTSLITEILASIGFRVDMKALRGVLTRVALFGAAVRDASLGMTTDLARMAESAVAPEKTAELRTGSDHLTGPDCANGQNNASSAAGPGKLKSPADVLAKRVLMTVMEAIRDDIASPRRTLMEHSESIRGIREGVIAMTLTVSGVMAALAEHAIATVAGPVSRFDEPDAGVRKSVISAGLPLAAHRALNSGFPTTPPGRLTPKPSAIVARTANGLIALAGGKNTFARGQKTMESCRTAITGAVKAAAGFTAGIGMAVRVPDSTVKGSPRSTVPTATALLYAHCRPVSGFFRAIRANVETIRPDLGPGIAAWVRLLSSSGKMARTVLSGNFSAAGERAVSATPINSITSLFSALGNSLPEVFFRGREDTRSVLPDFAALAKNAATAIRNSLGKAFARNKAALAGLLGILPERAKETLGISVTVQTKEAETRETRRQDANHQKHAHQKTTAAPPTNARVTTDDRHQPSPDRLLPAQSAPVHGLQGGRGGGKNAFDPQVGSAFGSMPPPLAALAAQAAARNAQPLVSPGLAPSAGDGGRQTRNITIESNTRITVNGSPDPQRTANAVAGAQNDVNAALVRNVKGVAR